jgi:hypothetical protein
MPKANIEITVIPRDYFRWRARVRFMNSFPTRAEAVRYARRHGYNLVVECDEENGPQFDVLQDPGLARTAAVSFGLVEAENALI